VVHNERQYLRPKALCTSINDVVVHGIPSDKDILKEGDVVGFWPYEDPHYAFAVVMERGSKNNQFGSVLVMKEFFDWVGIYATEYLK
jgi:hypothetical protein